MFTGIIEGQGTIVSFIKDRDNVTFSVKSSLAQHLKIDQSLSHNGICLTVVKIVNDVYDVTAIAETLNLTASKSWKIGDVLNLERAAQLHARLDGHIVQGHVDGVGKVIEILDENGSWRYTISYDEKHAPLMISKGSICIDGVSLTVINPSRNQFQIAIIPYTYEHTSFKHYEIGTEVNLEFDLIGKYILRQQLLSTTKFF